MLDGLLMLLTLSIIMAVASFLAGSLPLSFSLSQSRLRLISTIGMGVLVGTALIVIIPEGVDTLYSAGVSTHSHMKRSKPSPQAVDVRWQTPAPQVADGQGNYEPRTGRLFRREDQPADLKSYGALDRPSMPASPTSMDPDQAVPKIPSAIHIHEEDAPQLDPHPPTSDYDPEPSKEEPPQTPHAWIGLSLILGFVLMYLIDTLPVLSSSSHSNQQQTNIYSLSDLSSSPAPPSHKAPPRTLSTTLGLCIHATADGIALGASSTTSTASLSLIIFVAIMVHKAPAAFGLTAVLLKQGLGKRGARAHLVVFSLAAPMGAVATWVIVRTLGGSGAEEEAMRWWTGILLLFSGGTFLYVAMHTMQEDSAPHSHSSYSSSSLPQTHHSSEEPLHTTNGYLEAGGRESHNQKKEGKSLGLVLAAVGGMLLPLLTQVGHSH